MLDRLTNIINNIGEDFLRNAANGGLRPMEWYTHEVEIARLLPEMKDTLLEVKQVLELASKEVQPYLLSNPEIVPTPTAQKCLEVLNKLK